MKPLARKPAGKSAAVKVASVKGKRPVVRNFVIEEVRPAGKLTVTFGEVSVRVTQPTEEAVQKGVKASVKVIRDLGKRLLTPGVEIKQANDIPVFTADPQNPNRVVRQLNGRSEVGHFIRGKFRADTVSA
ncbi:hypothetical protein SB772_01475 [Paraburkholderia sp. SIMBA_030]